MENYCKFFLRFEYKTKLIDIMPIRSKLIRNTLKICCFLKIKFVSLVKLNHQKYLDQHDCVAIEALEAVGQRGQGLATDRSVANSAEEVSL